jgi:hypothetical protein
MHVLEDSESDAISRKLLVDSSEVKVLGFLEEEIGVLDFAEVTGVTSVVASNFAFDSVARESHLFGVHDDHLISKIPLGSTVSRLVLASKVDAGSTDDFTEIHLLGIENVIDSALPFNAIVS